MVFGHRKLPNFSVIACMCHNNHIIFIFNFARLCCKEIASPAMIIFDK